MEGTTMEFERVELWSSLSQKKKREKRESFGFEI